MDGNNLQTESIQHPDSLQKKQIFGRKSG